MPGDNVSFGVELIAPIAMEGGLRFAIRTSRYPLQVDNKNLPAKAIFYQVVELNMF